MSSHCILFRRSLSEENEYREAAKFFPPGEELFEFRSEIPEGALVIGRYSVLPYYQELERELKNRNSRMINSYNAHSYIANMDWYHDLKHITPQTWFQGEWGSLPADESFIIKGLTNSRKFQWKTHMFAETKKGVRDVVGRLFDDTMLREQGIVVRKYIPLESFGEQINGLPISNEWRFFCLDGKILAEGFYWSNWIDELSQDFRTPPKEAVEKVKHALSLVPAHVRFITIAVAKTKEGDWTVIELNDGQMSGLSDIEPERLYSSLKSQLSR